MRSQNVVQLLLRHLRLAPFLICIGLGHLDVTAQASRGGTAAEQFLAYPATMLSSDTAASVHNRLSRRTQRSTLFCDISKPHLYVEACDVESRGPLQTTGFRQYSLHVHHGDLVVTPVAPRSRILHARKKEASSTRRAVRRSGVLLLCTSHIGDWSKQHRASGP